jgi:hypothetical protein
MVAKPMHHEPCDNELIAEYILVDPDQGDVEDARLVRSGVPVWALIGYLHPNFERQEWDDAAQAYQIPVDAVHAAVAFYDRHKHAIDTRIAANAFLDV